MKHLNKFLLAVFFVSAIGISYSYGKIQGLTFLDTSIRNGIAKRYIKLIGNPKTQKEQCQFDYIVYNDSTECNHK